MEKRLFEYTPDLEENFELKKNETKNYVPCVVVDANTTWNIAYKLETKQFAKTLTKKSKTNIYTINNNNNNNKKKSP